jgi:hypothetical protein
LKSEFSEILSPLNELMSRISSAVGCDPTCTNELLPFKFESTRSGTLISRSGKGGVSAANETIWLAFGAV